MRHAMEKNHHVCCPTCGSSNAKRRHFISTDARKCPGQLVNQVECPACDYLMVTCAVDGRVLEAYSSGLMASSFEHQLQSRCLTLQS